MGWRAARVGGGGQGAAAPRAAPLGRAPSDQRVFLIRYLTRIYKMGSVNRFIGFFGGSVIVFSLLKGMDSVFYGLDER